MTFQSSSFRAVLALTSVTLVALAACSSTTCESRAITANPNFTSASCSSGSVKVEGESCSLGSPTSCAYSVNGTTITFAITSDFCKSSGTTSTGCGAALATCTGPALAKGSYAITNQAAATLVVDGDPNTDIYNGTPSTGSGH